ncbi:MAG: PD-(D/E)XK nuclease family protein [Clostridiales bacterium]|nr:PD-(D/E)XK nuclease family protein [Clostridiales bacterium]
MGRLIQQRRRELRLFGTAFAGRGLAAALSGLAREMLAYDVDPASLARAAENAGDASKPKLHDLALLYGDYIAALEDYSDQASGLAFLAKAITEQGFLSGATVFVDGYSSFTTRELAVLTALMCRAGRLEVALAIDPTDLERAERGQDIFQNCRQSYKKLSEVARQLDIRVEQPLIFTGERGRFAQNPELALVERHCYHWDGEAVLQEKPRCLRVVAAADHREEVAAAGREILRLVRENGLRYRDISVITRDLHPYEDLLPEVFGELDIPYFADSKKPLLYHPVVELFRSALEIWAGEAHYRQVFRYFKTGLVPLSAAETDRLENYCLAHGVRHWQWQMEADWQYWRGREDHEEAQKRLAAINELRRRGAAALIHFLSAAPPAQGPVGPAALFSAVRGLFAELEVERTLKEWQLSALAAGRAEEAALHRQALERLKNFLAEAELMLSDCSFEARQLLPLLDAGCAALTLSLIPPGLDQVLVASLERSRNPELRAAIVLGANADVLPGHTVPPTLLTDNDREELVRAGIELAPNTQSRQMAEHYLAYIALTRSRNNLFIVYAQSGGDGESLQPSPLIKRLQRIFPALKTEHFGDPKDASELTGGKDTLSTLAQRLRAARQGKPLPALWRDVYNWYASEEGWQQELMRIAQGLDFMPYQGRLNGETCRALYGETIKSSVSRLEKFNACPFAYFASYGLNLKPRPVYEITALERGEMIHKALAESSRLLAQGGPSWEELDKKQAHILLTDVLAELFPGFLSGILDSSARYRYLAERLRDTLAYTLMLLAEQIRRGKFKPVAWEIAFGSKKTGALPPLTVDIGGGRRLEISGQIDRVDIAFAYKAVYARVIDYKSGKKALYPEDILSGLSLQLPVYLESVLENQSFFKGGSLLPAGLYYMAVQDEISSGPMPPAGEEFSPAGLRFSGLTVKDATAVRLADPKIKGHSKLIPVALSASGFYARSPGLFAEEFRELRLRLKDILRETAQSMAGGLAAVAPRRGLSSDPCTYCDHSALCGFDGEIKRARQ